jgi:DNA-directed RNA polymerase sigma subunit (sigma70/sigma32)
MTEKVEQQGRPRLDRGTKISRERARQIQENALRKLRRRLRAMGITSMNDFI